MRYLLLFTLAGLVACGSTSTSSFNGEGSEPSPGGDHGGGTGGGSVASSSGGGVGGGGAAGVLTAGMWDDNLNYDFFGKYLTAHPSIPGDPGFVRGDFDAAHGAAAQRAGHALVDAALVIDTTGSMGDEIRYLTAEFANITSDIKAKFPNADQRWALVLYRDTPDSDPGDEYVVRSFDFTGDLQQFASTIGQQSAGNGGDYPESPELGLERLTQLAWRSDPSVARLAFWVGDAPHHDDRGQGMKQAIVDVRSKGVHLYPVSASGTNDLLELTMRAAAALTGGRYMFLTDDSGVGDTHKTPEIPCYFVTKLSKALVRAVSMELSGNYIGPEQADVIRTNGSPSADGKCATDDGQTVQIF
jgi:hypothetical protein